MAADEEQLPAGVRWPPVAEVVPCHGGVRCQRLTTTRAHYCCVPCRVTAESSRYQPATVHSVACDEAAAVARLQAVPQVPRVLGIATPGGVVGVATLGG